MKLKQDRSKKASYFTPDLIINIAKTSLQDAAYAVILYLGVTVLNYFLLLMRLYLGVYL